MSDKLNVTVLFKFPTDTVPILKQMTLIQPKEIVIPKKVLQQKPFATNSYIVYIIQAIDPTNTGLNYYLDSVVESQLRNARQIGVDGRVDNATLKVNTQDLFEVDVEEGVVRAVKPRSFYDAKFYRLKIRVALREDEKMSSSGYLIVQIDSAKESLFDVQVFETVVEENQNTVMHVFGKCLFAVKVF